MPKSLVTVRRRQIYHVYFSLASLSAFSIKLSLNQTFFVLNSRSKGFSSVICPSCLAFKSIPIVPVTFNPVCLAWNLPKDSSRIIKSASFSVAKTIAPASPLSKSKNYDKDFSLLIFSILIHSILDKSA